MKPNAILLPGIFAIVMGMSVATVALLNPGNTVSALVPVSLAFTTIGGLAGGVLAALKQQAKQIEALQQRLAEFERTSKPDVQKEAAQLAP